MRNRKENNQKQKLLTFTEDPAESRNHDELTFILFISSYFIKDLPHAKTLFRY